MHPKITSREDILTAAKALAKEQGLSSLQIRSVASRAHISVGSVYHYFPNKTALLSDVVADIWTEIFHENQTSAPSESFCDILENLFSRLQNGAKTYPDFFSAHTQVFPDEEKAAALEQREQIFSHICLSLQNKLEQDSKICQKTFGDDLSKEDFIRFVFRYLLLLLAENAKNCQSLIAVTKRVLYQAGDPLW